MERNFGGAKRLVNVRCASLSRAVGDGYIEARCRYVAIFAHTIYKDISI